MYSLQAKDANAAIKLKLVYRDEEELDTGVQKVQPLPYLGVYKYTNTCDNHVISDHVTTM